MYRMSVMYHLHRKANHASDVRGELGLLLQRVDRTTIGRKQHFIATESSCYRTAGNAMLACKLPLG
jgi:hypothetical protein